MIGALALHAYAVYAFLRGRAANRDPRAVLVRVGRLLWISAALLLGFAILIPALASKGAFGPGVVDRVGWIAIAVQMLRAVILTAALASWVAMIRPELGGTFKFAAFVLAILSLESPSAVALFGLVALLVLTGKLRWHEPLRGARWSRILLGALLGFIALAPVSWDETLSGSPGAKGLSIRVSGSAIRVLPMDQEQSGVTMSTGGTRIDDDEAPLPEPFASIDRRLAFWNHAGKAAIYALRIQGVFLLFSFFPPLLRLHGVGLKRRFAVMMWLVRGLPALLALLLLGIVIYFAIGVQRVSRATAAFDWTLDGAATLADALVGGMDDPMGRTPGDERSLEALASRPWLGPAGSVAHVVLRRSAPAPAGGTAPSAAAGGLALPAVASSPGTPPDLLTAEPFGTRTEGARRGLAVAGGALYLVASSSRPAPDSSLAVAEVFVAVDSGYVARLSRSLGADLRVETVPGQVVGVNLGGISFNDSVWTDRAIRIEAALSDPPSLPRGISKPGVIRIGSSGDAGDAGDRDAARPGAPAARDRFWSRPIYLGRRTLPVGDWSESYRVGGACRITLHATPRRLLGGIPDLALLLGEFNLGIPAIVGILLAMGVLQPISIRVGRGILKGILEDVGNLTTGARRLGDGDFDHAVPVRGNDELGGLARSFNAMAANLKRQREELKEKERMAADLAVAREIQQRLLPQEAPIIAGLDVAGASIPTHEVGGDLFHFIPLPDGRLALAVGDVAGKGVSAALLMSNALAGLRAHVQDETGVGACMTNMNRHITDQVEPGRFVTFFYGVLDPSRSEVRYGCAGHNPPLVVEASGATRWLTEGGPPFGVESALPYGETLTPLGAGDVLVVYSDGVTESLAAAKGPPGSEGLLTETEEESFYGEGRLEAAAVALRLRPAAEILAGIVESVRAFAAGRPQADDLTLVVVKVV